MFKKTEESEWTRFSRALSGKEQPRDREEVVEPVDELPEEEPAIMSAPAPAATPVQPAAPPPPPAATRVAPPEPSPATYRPPAVSSPPVAEPAAVEEFMPMATPGMRAAPDAQGESVICEGTEVEGTFRSEHSIRIRGNVQGEIESRQQIVVEQEARVNAKVTAEQITIFGEVNGEVTCPGRVEISPNGRVTGEISAGSLVMAEGAYFEGHLKMLGKSA